MKISFIDLIRSAFARKDEKFRKNLYVFLICLGISLVIWFTIKLSDEYDTLFELPVIFTNLPQNKVLTNISDTALQVEILEKGSDIFRRQYVEPISPLPVSLRFLPLYTNGSGIYRGVIPTALLINDIERDQNLLGKVISVMPDTIYLQFETAKTVKLPVKAEFDLNFEKEFMYYGRAKFFPDSVQVKGPERIIARLDSANLGKIKLGQLKENYSGEKYFGRDSSNRNLVYSPDHVTYTIPVEKYTEAEVEVPVKIINGNGLQAKTFPDKVRIYYTVALKDYAKIEPGMIQAVADIAQENIGPNGRVEVNLKNFPPYIRINKIEPEKVEFIIIK